MLSSRKATILGHQHGRIPHDAMGTPPHKASMNARRSLGVAFSGASTCGECSSRMQSVQLIVSALFDRSDDDDDDEEEDDDDVPRS